MASQSVKPFKECTLTRQELKDDGKKLTDFCGKCFRFGINCLVEDHPSEQEMAGNKINI